MRLVELGAVVFALVALACGGSVDSDARGKLDPKGIELAKCKVTDRFVVHAGDYDSIASSLAYSNGEVGLLWWSDAPGSPRELRFSRVSFSSPKIESWIPLTTSPVISDSGISILGLTFWLVWVEDGGTVHLSRPGAGTLESDTIVAKTNGGLVNVGLGNDAAGALVVGWSSNVDGTSSRFFIHTSADGLTLSDPKLISETGKFAHSLSFAPSPAGAAVAWSAQYDDSSELRFAEFSNNGDITIEPFALTHHNRYVYDVALGRGANRYVISTTDSRVDIYNVPVYSTSLSLDGEPGTDRRLTTSGGHEFLDMTFDGAAFALAYDEHDGIGTQIIVRQLDETADDLFGATQISQATYKRSGCCTDTRYAKVVSDGDGRALVFWSEVEARPTVMTKEAFTLKAALLDCRRR